MPAITAWGHRPGKNHCSFVHSENLLSITQPETGLAGWRRSVAAAMSREPKTQSQYRPAAGCHNVYDQDRHRCAQGRVQRKLNKMARGPTT
jgi:hypothetical protein